MTRIWKAYAQASLILRVTVALVLGVVVGLIGGETVAAWLAPLGDLLLRLLTFLIVPIVLFTLMVGVNQSREEELAAWAARCLVITLPLQRWRSWWA